MTSSQLLCAKGELIPLLIPVNGALGPSFTNPSIFADTETGEVLVNIRSLNYILYHSEFNHFEHPWGPIVYLHPESELKLKTINVLAKLTSDLSGIEWYSEINTSEFDKTPMWEFHGLEDARLVKWEDKLYTCGVRRDTTPNGVGRMEMSELYIDKDFNKVIEKSRFRIPIPGLNENASYCEKNWVPILDRPNQFLKWSNPTEIVSVDRERTLTTTTYLGEFVPGASQFDWRGGSQLVRVDRVYMHFVHETNLYYTELGRKDAIYRHRVLLRDVETLEVIGKSAPFSFMGGKVEFCCGLAINPLNPDNLLITFGFQDNAAFLLNIPSSEIFSLCIH